jgi:uncharacterized damage-inducible protein DinB
MMACIEILVDHNIACRQPILDAVENLTNEEFIKDMGVGIGSIRDILVHLVNTEDYWISLLKGKDTKKINPENFNDIDTIRKIWAERETSTKDFLEYQNDRTLQVVRNVTWDGVTVHFTVAKALIHMATHETHHRGLIIGIIRQLRYEPPNVNML